MENNEKTNSQENKKRTYRSIKRKADKEARRNTCVITRKKSLTSLSIIPYKKFNFFEKYILKRKQYQEYLQDRETSIQRDAENKKRLKEIEVVLLSEGASSIDVVAQRIACLDRATTFEELGFTDSNKAIEMLVTQGIDFKFESYEQAFELAPDFLGNNIEFMQKAIKKDIEFIKYDKTDNEELYKEAIEIKIRGLRTKKAEEIKYIGQELEIDRELQELEYLRQELESPKQVGKGKYKVPHKFMFEEIRNNVAESGANYWYRSVDGVYDKEFAEELQSLYENPDIIVGVHGLKQDENIENAIFTKGLKNSMQSADVALERTVAFGENLTFTKLLDYRIPYNGIKTESAIILTLPRKVLDNKNPVPIWGSNEKKRK